MAVTVTTESLPTVYDSPPHHPIRGMIGLKDPLLPRTQQLSHRSHERFHIMCWERCLVQGILIRLLCALDADEGL